MRVVFHHAEGDTGERVLGNVEHLLDDDSLSVDEVAVVANGDGVRTLAAGGEHATRVAALSEQDVVRFVACERSLAQRDLPLTGLVDGAETAASGVGTVARLQHAGFAYVKD